ncbi:hypothetical protein [Nonomuraea sp. NPDC049480]|uniref:hypothetical protein n=1 Tax=Nonomuraea sp. NPDC049480 TaxID=3364353 RepID=UPI0037910E85
MRIRRTAIATAFALGILGAAAPAAQATAGDAQPCGRPHQHNGRLVQNCPDWSPSGRIPVYASPAKGTPIGYINPAGTDWYVCEKPGGPYALGDYQNFWWALTMADNDKWGFVNEVYFRGGGNNQPDGGLRECPRPGGKPLPE